MSTGAPPMHADRTSRWKSVLALLLYASFVVYQSLADGGAWACSGPVLMWPRRASRSDVLANVVAYVPLGLLFVWAATRRWPSGLSAAVSAARVIGIAIAGIAATSLLSLCMELMQACQAHRVSSGMDLAANSLGGTLGVIGGVALWTMTGRGPSRGARPLATHEGRLHLLTALVVVVWILSQTMPWVFAADVGTVRSNLSFLKRIGDAGLVFDTWRWLRHAGAWIAVACASRLIGHGRLRSVMVLAVSGAASLVLQLLLDARAPLSFEELAGMATAAALVVPFMLSTRRFGTVRVVTPWAMGLLLGSTLAVVAYELRPEPGAAVQSFSLWPRVGLGGLLGALDYALFFGWFGLAAAAAAQWAALDGNRGARRLWPIAAVITTLGLEVAQTVVPGRGPDVSAPMFTLIAVLLATTVLVDASEPTR